MHPTHSHTTDFFKIHFTVGKDYFIGHYSLRPRHIVCDLCDLEQTILACRVISLIRKTGEMATIIYRVY